MGQLKEHNAAALYSIGLDHVPRDCVCQHCPTPLETHKSPPPEAHGPLRLHVTARDCHNTTCYSGASLKSVSSGQGRNLSVFVASKVFTLKNIWDKTLPCEKLLNLAITMVNILLGCEF